MAEIWLHFIKKHLVFFSYLCRHSGNKMRCVKLLGKHFYISIAGNIFNVLFNHHILNGFFEINI